ncbi:MAG TPA: DUF6456 domain-containing protein [Rhizomicrobium sp.]|nr:DUF6456 domain-containing protein [Rhizomicrobium sp.]
MRTALERTAEGVLRRLGKGARLEPRPDGSYQLRGARTRQIVSAETIALMRASGWLAEEGGALRPSAAGEGVLARAAAADDPFAAQHRILETKLMKDDTGRECYVVVNAAESPLALLRHRGLIDAAAFEAGERLRRDFTLAQLTPRLAVDYSAPVGRRSLKPETLIAETALAAKQRFNRAMRAAGPGLSDVLFDVCCILKGLEACERDRNWPRASAGVVLRVALDRLAGHYGARARPPRRRTRAWRKDEDAG